MECKFITLATRKTRVSRKGKQESKLYEFFRTLNPSHFYTSNHKLSPPLTMSLYRSLNGAQCVD